MVIIIKFILIISAILFPIIGGKTEGYYYDTIPMDNHKHQDIHWMFTITRGILFILFGIICFYLDNIWLFLATLALFPFFHLGSLYSTRNALNKKIYKKRWFDVSSDTSKAIIDTKTNFKDTPYIRIVLVILALLLILKSFL
jgi:hypothetical protein